MNEQNKDMEEGKKRYCKKCQKEVKPIKEPKTLGKRTANFFGIILLGESAYSFPKKCPYCGKVLRTKQQNICAIIFVIMMVILGIFYFIIKFIPKIFT